MKLFLDTEFNGFGGELLSMALVDEDGSFFYGRVPNIRPIHPWVEEHVMPKMGIEPVDRMTFRADLHRFLRKYQNPEIIADWHADFVHFFDAFHGADYSQSLDLSCTARLLSGPSDIRPENPHNALSDAIALRAYVMGRS
jgi:hypothetical protein